MPTISVIIATKNREEQLRTISLPSLARQRSNSLFEVILWDASDDDKSRRLAEAFSSENPGIAIRHFKAPRAGLTAQRNDALKEAKGDVLFFIDDDSEVSSDGINALARMFAADSSIAGGCLPLDYKWPEGTTTAMMRARGPWARVVRAYYRLFEPSKKASGYFPPIPPTQRKPVFYLFGCNMAFRKEVFATHRFEERLQRFSNYVICDDLILSRVLMQEGKDLRVADEGYVVHRAATGGRLNFGFNSGRVEGYNAGIVWMVVAFPWSRWTVFPFIWARAGVLSATLLPCLRKPWRVERWERVAGYLAGLWTFLWEEFFGFTKPETQLG